MATNNQPLNYVNYDFNDLVTSLQNNLQANQSAWKDLYRSGTGQMLIELFAAVGSLVLYYIERRAEETYLPTAQNYSSVVNLVRLLNYIPSRNISASSVTSGFQFVLSTPTTNYVNVPAFTALTVSGISYVTSQFASIAPGQTIANVPGIQGTVINIANVSNGSANQVYNITDTTIENSVTMDLIATTTVLTTAQTLQNLFQGAYTLNNADGSYSVWAPDNPTRPQTLFVYVNGVLWTQVSSFINAVSTSTYYTIRPELNGTISILFGDGVFGAIPPLGQTVLFTYLSSSGLAGIVSSTGNTATLAGSLYDTAGNIQTVTVTNTVPFLGGENAETVAQIKQNAPAVFSTGNRAVTAADFIALIDNFPGVAAVNVFGENENNPPNYQMFNQVQFCVILQNWGTPSVNFESALSAYLYSRSLTTVRYSYVAPVILQVVPTLNVKLTQGTIISQAQSLIETAVQSLFVLGGTVTLQSPVYQSAVISAVEDIAGVINCHVTLKIQKNLTSGGTWTTTMDALPALAGAVELWVGGTQAGVDNGSGGWTNMNGYTLTGSVNYSTTGAVSVTISPAPGVGITPFIRYQQNNLGDIAPTQNQICQWNSDVYTYIGY